MSAGLALVAAPLAGAALDGLLVGNLRPVRFQLEPIFGRELLNGDLEVDFTLPQQHHLMQLRILVEQK